MRNTVFAKLLLLVTCCLISAAEESQSADSESQVRQLLMDQIEKEREQQHIVDRALPIPDTGDFQLALALPDERTSFEIGEPIEITLRLTCLAEPFKITHGWDYRATGYPQRCKVIVINEKGEILKDYATKYSMGGIGGETTVSSDKPHEFKFPLLAHVNITKSGTYHIYTSHDLGWQPSDRHPIAKTTVQITRPSPESAQRRVTEILEKSDEYSDTASRLRAPIYLPALKKAAQSGNSKAVEGITTIENSDAMRALVELIDSNDREVSKAAAQELCRHLPTPSTYRHEYRYWDKTLNQRAIEAACRLMEDHSNTEKVTYAANIIHAIGSPESMPAVSAAIAHWLENTPPARKNDDEWIGGLPNPLNALQRAASQLIKRGHRIDHWNSDAELALGLIQLRLAWFDKRQKKADTTIRITTEEQIDPVEPPINEKWRSGIERAIKHDSYLMRYLALQAIPLNVKGNEFEDIALASLSDEDLGIKAEACRLIATHQYKACLPHLLNIVQHTTHEYLFTQAAHSASGLGVASELGILLTERLADKELHDEALYLLFTTVLGWSPSSAGGNSNTTDEERMTLRETWRTFFQNYEDALDEGKVLSPAAPEITIDLVKLGDTILFNCSFEDGTSWPK